MASSQHGRKMWCLGDEDRCGGDTEDDEEDCFREEGTGADDVSHEGVTFVDCFSSLGWAHSPLSIRIQSLLRPLVMVRILHALR